MVGSATRPLRLAGAQAAVGAIKRLRHCSFSFVRLGDVCWEMVRGTSRRDMAKCSSRSIASFVLVAPTAWLPGRGGDSQRACPAGAASLSRPTHSVLTQVVGYVGVARSARGRCRRTVKPAGVAPRWSCASAVQLSGEAGGQSNPSASRGATSAVRVGRDLSRALRGTWCTVLIAT